MTICLPDDADLRATVAAFRDVQNAVSATAFHDGTPLRAVEVQRAVYEQVKGTLNSQMTITALRLVAGAYASAKHNRAHRLRAEARRKTRCEALRVGVQTTHHRAPGRLSFRENGGDVPGGPAGQRCRVQSRLDAAPSVAAEALPLSEAGEGKPTA